MSRVTNTKKRKTPSQRGLSRIQADFFNASNDCIVPENYKGSTHLTKDLSQSHNCSKITSLIEQHRLSDCLQCLENAGYEGDTAVFMLAFIQAGGAA